MGNGLDELARASRCSTAMRALIVVIGLLGCGGSRPARSPANAAAPTEAGPAAPTNAAGEPGAPKHRDMLEAIDRFFAAPLDTSRDETTRLLSFVSESSDVNVILSEQVMQWTSDGVPESASSMLLLAYMLGDASAQLRTGKKADDVHGGVDGVLKVYRVLKTRSVKSPTLDHLLELESQGKLGAYLDQLAAQRR
jgi:hypothetical protein